MKRSFSISFIFIAIVISALFIAHCGSGGGDTGQSYWGGGSGGGTTPTPTPTSTIPVVSTINTETGNATAYGGEKVVIVGSNFGSSTRANPGTVTFNGVEATDIISWENDAITCLVPLMANSGPVEVIINGVPSNTDITFTRVRKFRGAKAIGQYYDTNLYQVHAAGGITGDAMSVYVPTDSGGNERVFASRFDPATDMWSTPACIDPEAGTDPAVDEYCYPGAASDSQGNWIVVMKNRSAPNQIFTNTWNKETNTWSGCAQLTNATGSENVGKPIIRSNATGEIIIAVWQQEVNDAGSDYDRAWAAVYDVATGTWGAPAILDPGHAPPTYYQYCDPHVDFDEAGNAWVAFHDRNVTPGRAFAIRYDRASAAWGTPTQITNIAGNMYVERTRIAAMPDGRAMACYKLDDNVASTESIYCVYYDGSAWGAPVRVDNGETWACANEMGGDSNGNIFVYFKSWDATHNETAYVNRYNAATAAWGGPVIVQDPAMTAEEVYRGSIAAGLFSGGAICSYTLDSELTYANSFDPVTGTWSTPILCGSGCYNEAACDPAGNGTIVYKDDNSYIVNAVRYY